jgi:DNA-directed RNA polymerase subunit L
MEIKILNNTKEELEIEIDNLTLVELLRVYLNQDSGVVFAAWKKEHFTKNPVLSIKTKGKTAKKSLNDAINQITKELEHLEEDFKKLK